MPTENPKSPETDVKDEAIEILGEQELIRLSVQAGLEVADSDDCCDCVV